MNIVEKAFVSLYPDRDLSEFKFNLKYSGRFSDYNGHVKYGRGSYDFQLSKKWRTVSPEIQMGIVQHLMQKVFKTKT